MIIIAIGGDVFMPLAVFTFTDQFTRIIEVVFDNQLRLIFIRAFQHNEQVFTDAFQGNVFWRDAILAFRKNVFRIRDGFNFDGTANFFTAQNVGFDNRIFIYDCNIYWLEIHSLNSRVNNRSVSAQRARRTSIRDFFPGWRYLPV